MKTTYRTFSLVCFWCAAGIAQTPGLEVIHSFGNYPNGASPYGTLARGADGTLYGTTYSGGAANLGVIFKVALSGQYTILYNIKGGSDGANPYAGVTIGADGSLYGTTFAGGAANAGTVYKLDASGSETVLYSFTGGADGGFPYAGVIADSSGNLYGTTVSGGAKQANCTVHGCGVVYKVTPSGQETVLYTFPGGAAGESPKAGVIADAAGNLYGTTVAGGLSTCEHTRGCGVVYKVDSSGHETVLYAFKGGADGAVPAAGVIADAAGNLYGTTTNGGLRCNGEGCGTVYKVTPSGQKTTLIEFSGQADGGNPLVGLTRDAAGNLYGTAQGGVTHAGNVYRLDPAGDYTTLYWFPATPSYVATDLHYPTAVILDPSGNLYGATWYQGSGGMVYKLDPSNQETTLHAFSPAPGGTSPWAGVILDPASNLYGTTYYGGASNAGAVYKIDAEGRLTTLYSFTGGTDGGHPSAGVVRDSAGNLYGITTAGGPPGCLYSRGGCGVVYKLDPSGQETVLHTFATAGDGYLPESGVTLDAAGNLYGTTVEGGPSGAGIVYRLDPSGNETVLYSFAGGSDGAYLTAGVVLDPAGNLYGTTLEGGADFVGIIYKLDPSGNKTKLFSFGQDPTGAYPHGGVILDPAGNLYGTATSGGDLTGATGPCPAGGCGVVYELDSSGAFTVLYTFTGGAHGGMPFAAWSAIPPAISTGPPSTVASDRFAQGTISGAAA